MKVAGYITTACTLSVAVASASEPRVAAELLAGMLAPLVVAVTTIVLVERTYRRDPKKLTALMIKAFGTKMVIFGAYVGVVISLTPLRPIPFVLSFCAYFIALHVTEAWLLRSLFAQTSHESA